MTSMNYHKPVKFHIQLFDIWRHTRNDVIKVVWDPVGNAINVEHSIPNGALPIVGALVWPYCDSVLSLLNRKINDYEFIP